MQCQYQKPFKLLVPDPHASTAWYCTLHWLHANISASTTRTDLHIHIGTAAHTEQLDTGRVTHTGHIQQRKEEGEKYCTHRVNAQLRTHSTGRDPKNYFAN